MQARPAVSGRTTRLRMSGGSSRRSEASAGRPPPEGLAPEGSDGQRGRGDALVTEHRHVPPVDGFDESNVATGQAGAPHLDVACAHPRARTERATGPLLGRLAVEDAFGLVAEVRELQDGP